MYIEPETYVEQWLRESLAEGYDADEGHEPWYDADDEEDMYHRWIEENQ